MRPFIPALLLFASLAFACEAPKDTDELGTDETDSDGGNDETTEGAPECECIANQPLEELPSFPTCGEVLCDLVVWTTDEGITDLASVEAAECALTALRDRTPGIVGWSASSNDDYDTSDGYVLIFDDGTAAIREWGTTGNDYHVGEGVRFELPEPAYYGDCLAMMNYECIKMGPHPDNELVVLETCVEGWSHGTF